jgi:hypothetical protein
LRMLLKMFEIFLISIWQQKKKSLKK